MKRRLSQRLDGWLFALALLLGVAALGYLSTRYDHSVDWTYGGRASLPPESRAVLATLKGPVQIVSYASPQGDLRQTIAGFIQRFQRVKPDINLRFVDPQQDPAAMREQGITVDGALILQDEGAPAAGKRAREPFDADKAGRTVVGQCLQEADRAFAGKVAGEGLRHAHLDDLRPRRFRHRPTARTS